jgi:hypothetical protein
MANETQIPAKFPEYTEFTGAERQSETTMMDKTIAITITMMMDKTNKRREVFSAQSAITS